MPQYDLESWVLDSMAAAAIELAEAEMNGRVVRLAPTMTSDFIAAQRKLDEGAELIARSLEALKRA